MRNREARVAESVPRAADFVRGHVADFPELRTLGKRLLAHEARLKTLGQEEYNTRGRRRPVGGVDLAALKNALRDDHLKRISRAAKRLMRFAPGVARVLAVPPKRASADALVRASRAMVKAVRRGRALFIEVGFPRDFLVRCTRATDELVRRAADGGTTRAERSRVVRGHASELRAARQVMEIMEAVLQPRLRSDAVLADEWRKATKVGGRMGRLPAAIAKRRAASGGAPTPAAG